MKKLFLSIIFLGLGLAVGPLLLGLLIGDSKMPDESRFDFEANLLEESENAFFVLKELEAYPIDSEDSDRIDKHLSEEEWDEDFVVAVLEKYAEGLNFYSSASELSYQNPGFESMSVVNVVILALPPTGLGNYSKLNQLKLIHLARQGRTEEAYDLALISLELGRNLNDSNQNLIEFLVGMNLKNEGLAGVNYLNKTLEVDDYLISEEVYKRVLNVEYHFVTSAIDSLMAVPFYFEPNRTRKAFGEAFDDLENARYELKAPPSFFLFKHFTRNSIGKRLLYSLVPFITVEPRIEAFNMQLMKVDANN